MIMTATTRIGTSVRVGAKNMRDVFPVMDALRRSAGQVMTEVLPGNLKRFAIPNLPVSTLSKARQAYGCNPLFRTGLVILSLRIGGAPRESAQRIVDWAQELVDQLYPDEELTVEVEVLISRAHQVDVEEDVARTQFLLRIPGAKERLVEKIREYQALCPSLIRSIELSEVA